MAGVTLDLLVTWPVDCDYPVWRRWLAANRMRFDRVIVAFSPMPGSDDWRDQLRPLLAADDVTCLDTRWEDGADWRDAAVNAALNVSEAAWVWFTEQDFHIVEPDNFWRTVYAHLECADAIGVRADTRWHPCSLFVHRDAVEATSRYFGSDPVDHFYRFGKELEAKAARFVNIDAFWPYTYNHMQGLSHNFHLVRRGEEVTFKPDEFARYLWACRHSGVPLVPEWTALVAPWLARYHLSEEG